MRRSDSIPDVLKLTLNVEYYDSAAADYRKFLELAPPEDPSVESTMSRLKEITRCSQPR
ncbi:MAG: hypothetical protein AB2L14_36830 [Candidatus Xenobiia bacterium LiM19]